MTQPAIRTRPSRAITLWLGDALLGVVVRHPHGDWVGLTGTTTRLCPTDTAALMALTAAIKGEPDGGPYDGEEDGDG